MQMGREKATFDRILERQILFKAKIFHPKKIPLFDKLFIRVNELFVSGKSHSFFAANTSTNCDAYITSFAYVADIS